MKTIIAETGAEEGRSLSEQAYDRIRHDILLGALFPDEKLQIEAISERYRIGTVPVREALNQLSSEGLVYRRSNRGFFVQTISIADLEELVKTRIWLETRALTELMAKGDDAWEDALVVGYHRLARIQRRLPSEVGREVSDEWELRHKEFHMLLLDRCGIRLAARFLLNADGSSRALSQPVDEHQSQQTTARGCSSRAPGDPECSTGSRYGSGVSIANRALPDDARRATASNR